MTVASAGVIADITATALTTGSDVYKWGKLNSVDEAAFDLWIDSITSASKDMHLKLDKVNDLDRAKGEWSCTLWDDRGAWIDISVDERSKSLCRTKINVGWFGSEPTARLTLARIRLNYEKADRHLAPTSQPVSSTTQSGTS